MVVWVRSMRSCYNETSVRYFDNRQFTNTMLDIKTFISLFHLWNGRPRLIIVFQVLGSCLSKTRDYVQFWFWWPQWVLGFVPICVFKKLKLVLAVLNSQNNGPVLLFKTIFRLWNDFSCCLFKLWMARMKNFFFFMSLCYACRNHARIIMVGDPRFQFRFFVPPFSMVFVKYFTMVETRLVSSHYI